MRGALDDVASVAACDDVCAAIQRRLQGASAAPVPSPVAPPSASTASSNF